MPNEMLVRIPKEVAQAIGLPREMCKVLVLSGDLKDRVWCADDLIGYGCRGDCSNGGCVLRNSSVYREGSTTGFPRDLLEMAAYILEEPDEQEVSNPAGPGPAASTTNLECTRITTENDEL